jgi:hypothetical protein
MSAGASGHEFALLPSCVSSIAGPRFKLLKLRPALPHWYIVALWRKDSATALTGAFIAAAVAISARKAMVGPKKKTLNMRAKRQRMETS